MSFADANAEAAKQAGLVYTTDESPGITRHRHGSGFSYRDPSGHLIKAKTELARIRALAIPPAYRDVWICPDPHGHLQATGYDDRGRKQYRYHPDWIAVRDQEKFERMAAFGEALPSIRERIDKDLRRHELTRERVLATVVALLEKTLIRVGNEEYAQTNKSYGLTTLRNRHALISGSTIRFKFKGKSGVRHDVSLRDRRLAPILKCLQELPGQDLFAYVDEIGETKSVTSADVNDYLKEISGESFTAKDFRTWAGTLAAYGEFIVSPECDTETARKRAIAETCRHVARLLGNTPTVCRKSYIHHAVLAAAAEELPFQPPKGDLEKGLLKFLRKLRGPRP